MDKAVGGQAIGGQGSSRKPACKPAFKMPSRGPSAGLITASNAFALHLSRYSTVSEFRVELLLVATHVGTLHTSNTRVQPAYESLFLWANEQAELKNLKHTVPLKKLADILSLRVRGSKTGGVGVASGKSSAL